MRKILESCPSCEGDLEITELHCPRCAARVQARFRPCDFCRLTQEQSTFLRIFLTSRGNLSEVEKRLGVSYPTVRAKLDELIARLEVTPEPAASQAAPASQAESTPRRAIIDAVARGEIAPAEGLERLRRLGGDD